MHQPRVTVVVPTLASDRRLLDCLAALENQTLNSTGQTVEIVVVDNSGTGRIHSLGAARHRFRLIEPGRNLGFGSAVNAGARLSEGPYVAVINDDAVPEPGWLGALTAALDADPTAGMAASHITLAGTGKLDSAGMLLARDGSSKQRGHLESPGAFLDAGETLFPSGCAAIYRREVFEQTGGFDDSFFLYCEDADLGLRAQWLGWRCLYVPSARVAHHYSASAGPASERKAWFVERNRLRLIVRDFPLSWLAAAPFYAMARYFWHFATLFTGRGKAAEFRAAGGSGWKLPWLVFKAHIALLASLTELLRQRAVIRRSRRASVAEFTRAARRHLIEVRKVAEL